jgi:hypothetical protein
MKLTFCAACGSTDAPSEDADDRLYHTKADYHRLAAGGPARKANGDACERRTLKPTRP